MKSTKPPWLKDQTLSADFEVIQAKRRDDYKDFIADDGSYALIRTYHGFKEIGVAICDYNHVILKEFRGKRAQDLYMAVFDYSKKNNKNWFKRLDHAAYLGKELKKAEICLENGTEYVQE